MTRFSVLTISAALLLLLLVTRSSAHVSPVFEPPPPDESAEIGVAYSVVTTCLLPIRLGDRWWSFQPGHQGMPAPMPGYLGVPYPVPGTMTLTSPTEAVFHAVTDGSELAMTVGGSGGDFCF